MTVLVPGCVKVIGSIGSSRTLRDHRPHQSHQAHHGNNSTSPCERYRSIGVKRQMKEQERSYSGCKLLIPNLDDRAPVMNGRTALPAWPNPAIQPIAPVRIQRGRTRPVWFMVMGYIGPSSMPTNETATASPMREGTNQTVSSRLFCFFCT